MAEIGKFELHMNRCRAAMVSLVVLLPSSLSAAAPLVIQKTPTEPIQPGHRLEYLVDADQSLTIGKIQAGADQFTWTVSNDATPSFGYRDGAVWAKLSIVDKRREAEPLVLEIAYPPLDTIDVYVVSSTSVEHQQAGDHILRGKWAMDTRNPAFPIDPDDFADDEFTV